MHSQRTIMDLKTKYLGLELKNPFVVGSCPLSNRLESVKRLEDAGASAIVMHSLFEEQIIHEASIEGFTDHRYGTLLAKDQELYPKAEEFPTNSEEYLGQIQKIKESTDLPVIASLNGISEGIWIEYSRQIEQAGADALELNLYVLPTDNDDSSHYIEKRMVEIVDVVRNSVSIPLSVKLSQQFTSLPNFAQRLEYAGANGIVLFNQLFQADIDLARRKLIPRLYLTEPRDILQRLRWVSILFGRYKMDLALSGGVHSGQDAFKAILCGAQVVQCVSAILKHGAKGLKQMIADFAGLVEQEGVENLETLRGSMAGVLQPNPEAVERAHYLRILQGWAPDPSIWQ